MISAGAVLSIVPMVIVFILLARQSRTGLVARTVKGWDVERVIVEGVTKRFDDVVAVDDVTLACEEGEFLVLLGPSGSGKTTLLRLIAGLEEATAGEIVIAGRNVTQVPPKDRDIAMVFQHYALYPHMTVRKNLELALRQRKVPRDVIEARTAEVVSLLQIDSLLERLPRQLSGGQQQRVAVGRAIMREPKVFLMDEPLSNLDARLRMDTRRELITLQRRLSGTFIYVTHDQNEAMTMGTRVAIMRDGVIQQQGSPIEIFSNPANVFVAGFHRGDEDELPAGEADRDRRTASRCAARTSTSPSTAARSPPRQRANERRRRHRRPPRAHLGRRGEATGCFVPRW